MKDGKTNLEKKNSFNERYEDFKTFEKLLKRKTNQDDVPAALEIKKNIPIYSGQLVRDYANSSEKKQKLLTEWSNVFKSGAGIIAITNAIKSSSVIETATKKFEAIIKSEKKMEIQVIILLNQELMIEYGILFKSTVWKTHKTL